MGSHTRKEEPQCDQYGWGIVVAILQFAKQFVSGGLFLEPCSFFMQHFTRPWHLAYDHTVWKGPHDWVTQTKDSYALLDFLLQAYDYNHINIWQDVYTKVHVLYNIQNMNYIFTAITLFASP